MLSRRTSISDSLQVVLAVVAALAVAGSAAPAAPRPAEQPLLVLTTTPEQQELFRADPLLLDRASPAVPLAGSVGAHAFSPDGSTLAWVSLQGDAASLELLDVGSMSPAASVPLGELGASTVAWLARDRVVVLAERPDGLRILVVDAATSRLVSVRQIPAHFAEFPNVAPAKNVAVVQVRPLASAQPIGPVRLAVVPASGAVRVVRVTSIEAGAARRTLNGASFWEIRRPAVVGDPAGERAYVIGAANEPVASVDLRSLHVSYHRVHGLRAAAGTLTGTDRHAAWVRPGLLALVGFDEYPKAEPVLLGLRLLDTRTWRMRTIDPSAEQLAVVAGTIVAQHADPALPGFTIAGFDANGSRRFALPLSGMSQPAEVTSTGRHLYVPTHDGVGTVIVLDQSSGAIVGRPLAPSAGELLSPP